MKSFNCQTEKFIFVPRGHREPLKFDHQWNNMFRLASWENYIDVCVEHRLERVETRGRDTSWEAIILVQPRGGKDLTWVIAM